MGMSRGEKVPWLAEEFGISRKKAYKIIDRYEEMGLQRLTDWISRPYRHANQLPFQIETQIVRLKQEKPTWVAPKIAGLLVKRYQDAHRLTISTIHAVFDLLGQHGFCSSSESPRSKYRKNSISHPPKSEPTRGAQCGKATKRQRAQRCHRARKTPLLDDHL